MHNSISGAISISQILFNALQFLLSIAGVIAILGLVIAGILYLTAGGDTGRIQLAKNAFFASVIGIVVVVGALVIVNLFVSFFA